MSFRSYPVAQWRIYKDEFRRWCNYKEIIWVLYKFVNSVKSTILLDVICSLKKLNLENQRVFVSRINGPVVPFIVLFTFLDCILRAVQAVPQNRLRNKTIIIHIAHYNQFQYNLKQYEQTVIFVFLRTTLQRRVKNYANLILDGLEMFSIIESGCINFENPKYDDRHKV